MPPGPAGRGPEFTTRAPPSFRSNRYFNIAENAPFTRTPTEADADFIVARYEAPALAVRQPSVEVTAGRTATNSGTFSGARLDFVNLTASRGAGISHSDGTWKWSYPIELLSLGVRESCGKPNGK